MRKSFQYKYSCDTAFTLIELLVVVAIIITLSAFLLPILMGGQRAADDATNAGVMHTVDKAISIYKSKLKFGITPTWLASDPADAWGNHLYYKLSHDLTETEKTDFKTTLQTRKDGLRTRYLITDIDGYKGTHTDSQWSNSYDNALPPLSSWKQSPRWRYYNNLLAELGKREVHSVKSEVYSSQVIGVSDIGKSFIGEFTNNAGVTRQCVLDVYGNPLIYCYKYDVGVPELRYCKSWQKKDSPFKGIPDPSTLDANGLVDANTKFTDVIEGGRATIIDENADMDIEDDWAASDIRTQASVGWEKKHELWSAGPDGLFHPTRGDLVNEDNYTMEPSEYK